MSFVQCSWEFGLVQSQWPGWYPVTKRYDWIVTHCDDVAESMTADTSVGNVYRPSASGNENV